MSIFSKLIANQYYFDGGGYVRDGLIFMFDSKWNAGKDKYKSNANYMMNLVNGKKYPLHDFGTRWEFNENQQLVLKSINDAISITEVPIDLSDMLTLEVVFTFSTDNVEELKTYMTIGSCNFVTRTTKRFAIVDYNYKSGDNTKYNKYGLFYDVSLIYPNITTFSLSRSSILNRFGAASNGISINPIAVWNDTTYINTSSYVPNNDMQFKPLPNGINVYISSIRIYNRQLSNDEILINTQLDNSRFVVSN